MLHLYTLSKYNGAAPACRLPYPSTTARCPLTGCTIKAPRRGARLPSALSKHNGAAPACRLHFPSTAARRPIAFCTSYVALRGTLLDVTQSVTRPSRAPRRPAPTQHHAACSAPTLARHDAQNLFHCEPLRGLSPSCKSHGLIPGVTGHVSDIMAQQDLSGPIEDLLGDLY